MRYVVFCFAVSLALFATEVSSLAATAKIGSIKVGPGGSRIEIQGDQPLTYLYRKITGGSGIMLDIAPGKPAGIPGEIPGAGHLTGIWVKELQVDGIPVTRLVIGMDKEMTVNVARDSGDPGRLLVTFPALAHPDAPVPGEPPLSELLEPQGKALARHDESADALPAKKQPATKSSGSEPARTMPAAIENEIRPLPVPAAPPVRPKVAAVPTLAQVARPVVEAVIVGKDTIEIVTGSGATQYDSFRLNGPDRLVIDLPGAASSMSVREVRIGKFGVARLRIGLDSDKVRVVFDANAREEIPLSIIQKTSKGLKVTFAATKTRK